MGYIIPSSTYILRFNKRFFLSWTTVIIKQTNRMVDNTLLIVVDYNKIK